MDPITITPKAKYRQAQAAEQHKATPRTGPHCCCNHKLGHCCARRSKRGKARVGAG